jgi:hypothetical protein
VTPERRFAFKRLSPLLNLWRCVPRSASYPDRSQRAKGLDQKSGARLTSRTTNRGRMHRVLGGQESKSAPLIRFEKNRSRAYTQLGLPPPLYNRSRYRVRMRPRLLLGARVQAPLK